MKTKSDVIFFRAGGPLAKWIRDEAKRLGQTVSEFMRRMVEAAKKGGTR
jgi:hypothetical protein